MRCLHLLVSLVVLALVAAESNRAVRAENWPQWRGPGGSAISSETDLPLRWSKTENIRWTAQPLGEGYSSPIVCGQTIFLTAALDHGMRRLVHALDRATGQIRWTRELADDDPEVASSMTGHAAPTPATDGKRVVAFFGNAGVVCHDFEGRQLWHRDFGRFDSELGLASSPVIYGDTVLVLCDHDGDRFKSFDSFLIALDLATGQTRWQTDRRGLYRSWSTPLVIRPDGGKPELVVNAQEQLRSYDPASGKLLWHVDGMTDWVTPSPVFGDGLVFATSGRDGPVLAVRPGGEGDVAASRLAWRVRGAAPYVCSPLWLEGLLYVHNEQGILSCYRAATGKLLYRERLEGKFVASAVAGDGKLYVANEDGTTYVLRAGEKFDLLAANRLEEYTLSSPAIADGAIFIRTRSRLYCVE